MVSLDTSWDRIKNDFDLIQDPLSSQPLAREIFVEQYGPSLATMDGQESTSKISYLFEVCPDNLSYLIFHNSNSKISFLNRDPLKKLGLFDQDSIDDSSLIFILTSIDGSKIIGIYTQLSQGLKFLYLSDEVSMLIVNQLNQVPKACLNQTYSGTIGHFKFKEDDLLYTRNLTQETEVIQDTSKYIKKEDYKAISDGCIFKITPETHPQIQNKYHKKAIETVDLALSQRFKELSILLKQYIHHINYVNQVFDMTFDYDLIYKSNQYYQTINQQLSDLDLEGKVNSLKGISNLVQEVQEEVKIIRDLRRDLEAGSPIMPKDTSTTSLDLSHLYSDNEWEQWENLSKGDNHVSVTANKHHVNLYGSPTASSKPLIAIKIKEKDTNAPKKTVNFNLEQSVTYVYDEKEDS